MHLSETNSVSKKNIIIPNNYTIDLKSETLMNKLIEQLNETELIEINKILILLQQIELIKVNVIIELVNKYIERGHSIAIFVNFIETLNSLKKKLNIDCTIQGDLLDDEKQQNINDFQKNKKKIILCTLQSGGQSISLHDTSGKHPRVSIISPSFSSVDLVQSLGRIYRAGTKSHAIQHIIFCGNTYEEKICENIKQKINFMSDLTDDDLTLKTK
jgi:SNF2 family DNA or RNA helicase